MNRRTTPDILILLSDQHRYDALSAYGNRQIKTPNLDRLAGEGVVFDSAFCPFPVCAPSRYSLLTSLYPSQHTAWKNKATLPPGLATFPRALRDAGYGTAAVGKMHLTPTYADVGFEKMVLAEQDGPGRHDDDYHRDLRKRGLCDVNDLTDQVEEFRRYAPPEYHDTYGALVSNLREEDHSTTWIADRTVEAIAGWDDRPQLLFSSFIKPHHPFDPPAPWDRMYDPERIELLPGWIETQQELDAARGPGYLPNTKLTEPLMRRITAHYYGTISHMDDHIGRILEELKRSGRYENTIVIYASDHGEFMGFHHMVLKHNYMYEPLVRVPMIWKCAAGEMAGTRRDELVSLLDLGPTLMRLTGITFPRESSGIDIFSGTAREYMYAEFDDEYMIRTDRYKLLYMQNTVQRQLIDLVRDPLERENRYNDRDYAEIRAELEEKLIRTVLFGIRPPVHFDPDARQIDAENVPGPQGFERGESIDYFRRMMQETGGIS